MKRRDALKTMAGGLGLIVGRGLAPMTATAAPPKTKRWSGHVVLPHGYTIPAHQVVELDPRRSTTVEASGNIVVQGTLRMRPSSDGVVHTLRFVDVDESSFVGGGMDPLPSDVGLWVMGGGALDAVGKPKLSWARAEAVEVGARQLQLSSVPHGWKTGDEIAITPTLPPSSPDFTTSEVRTIRAILGNTVQLSTGVTYAHPAVSGPLGRFGPEILNLTRNVRIEGEPTGRSHIFFRPSRPQTLSNVAVRYMGPTQNGDGVVGRYGVHFHMAQGATRGSHLTGIVVRDCNSHAFVPHFSHGITFRDCISFSTMNDAYWWDQVPNDLSGPDDIHNYPYAISNDIVYDRCIAADVGGMNDTYRLCGFALNRGKGSKALGCVAVGVRQGVQSSGFQWPENNHGAWVFKDCVGHNNGQSGLFIWQNTGNIAPDPAISRFAAYHNNQGIFHGAYITNYVFEDCWCYANAEAGVLLAAQSRSSACSRYMRCTVDGAGLSDYAMRTGEHNFSGGSPTSFEDCRFSGARVACVGIVNSNRKFDMEIFEDCTYEGNEFWLSSTLDANTLVEVQDREHGNLILRPKGQPGTYRPEWNASVSSPVKGSFG